jgi:hypothetical protein
LKERGEINTERNIFKKTIRKKDTGKEEEDRETIEQIDRVNKQTEGKNEKEKERKNHKKRKREKVGGGGGEKNING